MEFDVVLSPNSKMNATELGNAFTKALESPGALGNYTADLSYTSFEGKDILLHSKSIKHGINIKLFVLIKNIPKIALMYLELPNMSTCRCKL